MRRVVDLSAEDATMVATLPRSRSRTPQTAPQRTIGAGPGHQPLSAGQVAALQAGAGNAAVVQLLSDGHAPTASVQRCGAAHPGCGCSDEERTAVQHPAG